MERARVMRIKIVILALMACCLGIFCWYRWAFPFGMRTCALPCTISALRQFARQHGGWFPREGKTDTDALRLLSPDYLDGAKLAGISGNVGEVERRLLDGRPLDAHVSSWVYWPGFRIDDDPQLAIIWEMKPSVNGIGRRTGIGGHAVGFAEGSFGQVSDSKWPLFLAKQKKLRESILSQRDSLQNAKELE